MKSNTSIIAVNMAHTMVASASARIKKRIGRSFLKIAIKSIIRHADAYTAVDAPANFAYGLDLNPAKKITVTTTAKRRKNEEIMIPAVIYGYPAH